MPELRISTDKVEEFIEAALEAASKVPSTAGDDTTTGDDNEIVALEDSEDDPTRAEIVSFINGLNIDEQVDLLAMIYLGRGDFAIEEWDDAVVEAEDRIEAGEADYMIGNSLMPGFVDVALGLIESAEEDEVDEDEE